jgi:hypothetical protein
MEPIEIKILQFAFRFRPLSWREEFAVKFPPRESRLRTILAHALTGVSGVPVGTTEEARRVLAPIPSSIIDRMFVIYKGSIPPSRAFSTMGLYRAPEPRKFSKRVMEAEEEREKAMDRVEEQMAAKFGRSEIAETIAAENLMARNSKMRGVTPATPDDRGDAQPPAAPEQREAGQREAGQPEVRQSTPKPAARRDAN